MAALHANDSLEAGLLAARALLRQRRMVEAQHLLNDLAPAVQTQGSFRYRSEHALLQAMSLSMRDDAKAAEAFVNARILAISSADTQLLGEVETTIAVAAFAAGDFDAAEMQLNRAARETSDVVWNCWIRQTRGAISAVRGNLDGQVMLELENLAALAALPEREVWLEAWVLFNLAVGASELDRREVATRVGERALSLAWTPATAMQQFQTFRHLAWSAALTGDQLKTFRYLRRSADVAPNALYKIQAVLDSALFYRELGERAATAERLDAAQELARGVNWEESNGEERFALLSLAELVAPLDAQKARGYLATYHAIHRKLAPQLIARVDGSTRARERQQSGFVASALGNTSEAIALLTESLQFWERRGIAWRAATASIELANLTGRPEDVSRATQYARRWPAAWFARRFGKPRNAQHQNTISAIG